MRSNPLSRKNPYNFNIYENSTWLLVGSIFCCHNLVLVSTSMTYRWIWIERQVQQVEQEMLTVVFCSQSFVVFVIFLLVIVILISMKTALDF
jgi:uncharacterized membrane protein